MPTFAISPTTRASWSIHGNEEIFVFFYKVNFGRQGKSAEKSRHSIICEKRGSVLSLRGLKSRVPGESETQLLVGADTGAPLPQACAFYPRRYVVEKLYHRYVMNGYREDGKESWCEKADQRKFRNQK